MIDKAEGMLGSEELFITEKLVANRQLKNDSQVQSMLLKCEQYPNRKENCKKLAPMKTWKDGIKARQTSWSVHPGCAARVSSQGAPGRAYVNHG
jgi:hypothetical protein